MNIRPRLIYTLIFLSLFAIEVSIALFVHDNIVRPYLGDILVTMLVYAFARILFPRRPRAMGIYVFLFALAIEIGQYFDFVKLMGLEGNKVICVVLGRTFSPGDLVCYAIGCIIFFLAEAVFNRGKLLNPTQNN